MSCFAMKNFVMKQNIHETSHKILQTSHWELQCVMSSWGRGADDEGCMAKLDSSFFHQAKTR